MSTLGDATRVTKRMFVIALVAVSLASPMPAAAGLDRGADGQFSERRSKHFLLLQDVAIDRYGGFGGSRQFERGVLDTLERAYEVVGRSLGIRPRTDVRVVVYDPDVFERRFARLFKFAAAGFFDGAIHVRGGTVIDARLARTLHHEYTHAALEWYGGQGLFPAWLNEGIAEYFERLALGQTGPTAGEVAALRRIVEDGGWIPIAELSGPTLAGMGSERAPLAYVESYLLVHHIVRVRGEDGLARLCESLVRSRVIDRALRRATRMTTAELEAAVLASLR